MTDLKIDRRQLLKMGLSSSVLAALPLGCLRLAQDDANALLEFVSDSSLPVDAGRTGVLNTAGLNALASLTEFVNSGWELSPDLNDYLMRLKSDLGLKTEYEPSYLTEYEHAIELIGLMTRTSDTVAQAWSSLLFSEVGGEDLTHTKLGRARRFVFSELITHQVALSGGFKSFGLMNYRGHFGGPFHDAGSYRRGEG